MTNYNYKKAILTTFLALPLLTSAFAIGVIPNAYAGTPPGGDLNPPDYRGANDSVFVEWQGGIPCLDQPGIPLGPPTNFSVITSLSLYPAPPDLIPLDPSLFGAAIPNIIDDHTTKNVRVQVLTCSFVAPVEAFVAGTLAEDNDEEVPIISDGNPVITAINLGGGVFLTHATYDFTIEPNPDFEVFSISTQDTTLVSVIVDTVSFSEREIIPGEIIVLKFNDLNGNGQLDGGEPGLPGWEIIVDCESGSGGTLFTDGAGVAEFLIDDVPSDCTVSETPQDGWIATTENPVDTFVDEGQTVNILFGNWQPGIHVHIDIKPQSCPNPINTNSRGLLPVAILGNEVNVENIDVSTVMLAGVYPILHSIEDVATPHTPNTSIEDPLDCSTEGPDGIDDLTLKFDTQDVVEALGAVRGDITQVELTGFLLDGTPIESYDVIIVR